MELSHPSDTTGCPKSSAPPPITLNDAELPAASAAALRGQAVTRSIMRPLTKRIRCTPAGVRLLRLLTGPPNRLSRPVKGTVIRQVRQQAVVGEWVSAAGTAGGHQVLLYLHGSAFTIMSASTHRGLVSRLSDRTGLAAFSVDYRLAPEHPFPAASDDVMSAYRYVLANGHRPADIAIVGDSAGAFLAVELALRLARADEPAPGALVLFSPLFELTLQLAAQQELATPDPLIRAADCRRLVELYLGEADRSDPRITLSFDDVGQFPPTLIQTGGHEMLQADAQRLHALLRAASHRSFLQVWPGQSHVFQAIASLPESALALREASQFLRWALDQPAMNTREARR